MAYIAIILLTFTSSLALSKSIRFAGIDGEPHFVYNDKFSKPAGLVPQFIDEYISPVIKKKYDLKIDWVQAPTARLTKELEDGSIDVLCFLVKTADREQKYHYGSKPFIKGKPAVIVRKDFATDAEISSLASFSNKTVAAMFGTTLPEELLKNNITVEPITGTNVPSRALTLLKNKRVDGVFIYQNRVGDNIINSYDKEKLLKVVTFSKLNTEIYVAFSKKLSPDVMKTIDEIFNKHQDDYTKLLKK